MACQEPPSEPKCMDGEGSRNTKLSRPWTSTSSLVVCPFLDFALACLLLGMATYFLVSRITQLCTNLVSCWTGGSEQDEQQHQRLPLQPVDSREQLINARFVAPAEARACLTCDRTGKLHGVCSTCIMQALGPQRDQDTRPLFLQEMMLDACRSKDLVSVSSSSSSENTTSSVALVLGRLHLQAPNDSEKTCESERTNRTCRCQPACGCSRGGACTCMQTPETLDHSERHPGSTSDHDEGPGALKSDKDEVIENLYYELDQERHAAAVAANESIAMITRLQEEKSSLLMEARQYQRVMEEKALYDHKAITILKDMLLKREAEKTVLEEEIEIYRKSSKNLSDARDNEEEPTTSETRKSSSQDETSAAIKAVEEERLSVLERVKRLEQQLQLLRGNDSCTYSHQRKRTSDHAAVDKPSTQRPAIDSAGVYQT